jgi:hypothetical protein
MRSASATIDVLSRLPSSTRCPRCDGSTWKPFGYSAQGVAREQCRSCGRIRNNRARLTREAAREARRLPRPCPKCGGDRFRPHGYGRNGIAIDQCLSCGRQLRNYQRLGYAGDARVLVSPTATSVEAALALIAAGVFSVDAHGAIWRHARFTKWGQRRPVDPPKRADVLRDNGYRRLHFKAGGRQHEANAARVVWVFRHGPVPPGYRVAGARGSSPHLATHVENGRHARRADGQPLIAHIAASVPTWLPDEVRDEVCQELAVAVLTGEATVEQIPELVRDYKARVNRTLWPYFERLSLDAPINASTKTTFGELG